MGNKDLIQQMRGRAKFCRDRGEIKTPELLERAINLLESQETERLKTELLAAEAEIARLQSALDDLKEWAQDEKQKSLDGDLSEYNNAKYVMAALFVENINRITGADK